MKAIVFGAAGFVGRHVIKNLLSKHYDVHATDIIDLHDDIGCEYEKITITDASAVKKSVKDSDFVINLSAHPLRASIQDPNTNAAVNIIGSLNILDAAREHKIKRVVFTSASSVIGTPQYNPVNEGHTCVPKTPYGVAKLSVENYMRVYQELYGLKYAIFRLYNVYGPGQSVSSGAVIPVTISKVINGDEVTVFGNGSSTRDYVYVEDVAEFIMRALELEQPGILFNLGTGRATTILELIKLISVVVGKEPQIAYKPSQPGEIGNFYADTKVLLEHFKKTPSTSLQDGLKKTHEWLRKTEK